MMMDQEAELTVVLATSGLQKKKDLGEPQP